MQALVDQNVAGLDVAMDDGEIRIGVVVKVRHPFADLANNSQERWAIEQVLSFVQQIKKASRSHELQDQTELPVWGIDNRPKAFNHCGKHDSIGSHTR